MKKSTFFLSLFLTVSGVATTNAQKTLLKANEITVGRVITLVGSGKYVKLDAAGLGDFDPKETAVVVEKAEGGFYLKKYSNGEYLQKAESSPEEVKLGNKDGAALFTITDASNNIRFVTTYNNGATIYLNTNAGNTPTYFTGTGVNSMFSVYDAVELCKQHYNYDGIISANSTEDVYVGDFVLSEDKKNAVKDAYDNYNKQFSEANYKTVVEASTDAAASQAVFDASLYYLIENNYYKGTYMAANNDKKLIGTSDISGSASQIWHLEEVADENKKAEFKYYLFTQGVCCGEPSKQIQVELSKEKQTSFYMITPPDADYGVYAFDSGSTSILPWGQNGSRGLLLSDDQEQVVGFGTAPTGAKWKLQFAKTYTVFMPTEGWTTLNLPFAVSLPEDESLTASYPTDAEKGASVNSVTMTPLNGNEIPANFPVVLQGEAGTTYTLTILPANKDVSIGDREANKFEGVLLPEPVNTAAMYKLAFSDGKFTLSEFEGSDVTVAANSAYIPFSSVTTGITDVVAADTNADNVWFDLVGRRVLNPAKGVYVNAAGKKALFK